MKSIILGLLFVFSGISFAEFIPPGSCSVTTEDGDETYELYLEPDNDLSSDSYVYQFRDYKLYVNDAERLPTGRIRYAGRDIDGTVGWALFLDSHEAGTRRKTGELSIWNSGEAEEIYRVSCL